MNAICFNESYSMWSPTLLSVGQRRAVLLSVGRRAKTESNFARIGELSLRIRSQYRFYIRAIAKVGRLLSVLRIRWLQAPALFFIFFYLIIPWWSLLSTLLLSRRKWLLPLTTVTIMSVAFVPDLSPSNNGESHLHAETHSILDVSTSSVGKGQLQIMILIE